MILKSLPVTYVGLLSVFSITYILSSIATVSGFNITKIDDTAVLAMWQPITAPEVKHYTVYYISTSKHKRQSDIGNKTFPAGSSEGIIGGLQTSLEYLFSLSVTYEINGVEYEGERTQPISFGKTYLIGIYLARVNYITNITQVNLEVRAKSTQEPKALYGFLLYFTSRSLSSLPSYKCLYSVLLSFSDIQLSS